MRITKISVIIFIFLLAVVITPTYGDLDHSNTNGYGTAPHEGSVGTDQVGSGPPEKIDFNASIADVTRNITVQRNARIQLEDEIKLTIHDNVTKIHTLNYTIPTKYAQYVHEVRFYSHFGESVGLESSNNSRSYTKFMGKDATTYYIDIRENGLPANGSFDTFIKTHFISFGNLDISLNGTGQRGVFYSPVVPMFPNLEVENSYIGIKLDGNQDRFQIGEIKKIKNKINTDMPRIVGDRQIIEYQNMSRVPYEAFEKLSDQDVSRLVYIGTTPIGETQTTPSTIVPSAIKYAKRDVTIDPWGTVFVEETVQITHLGATRNLTSSSFQNIHILTGSQFVVSDNALVTDVYDSLGSLEVLEGERDKNTNYPETTAAGVEGKQALSIQWRNGIYGGQTYQFTVEYRYNASEVISIDTDTNEYRLNATLFSDYNTTIMDLDLRVNLPSGANFVGHSYHPDSPNVEYQFQTAVNRKTLSFFRNIQLQFDMQDVSWVDNDNIAIYYTYTGFGHFEYIATYITITLTLLAFVYALSNISYKPSKAVEIEREQVPVEEMDHFFSVFSDKMGAEKRLAELRERRRKGKISKKDYTGKVKAIRKRLREINPELESAAKQLSEEGGRYENYVTKVMIASQRQSDIRRNAKNTKRDYERAEIPKNIYQRMMKEYTQELAKQESTINKTLAEMVEIIQKFNQ